MPQYRTATLSVNNTYRSTVERFCEILFSFFSPRINFLLNIIKTTPLPLISRPPPFCLLISTAWIEPHWNRWWLLDFMGCLHLQPKQIMSKISEITKHSINWETLTFSGGCLTLSRENRKSACVLQSNDANKNKPQGPNRTMVLPTFPNLAMRKGVME